MTNMGKNGENTGGRHNKWTETAEAAGLLFGAHAGWRSLLAAPGDTAAAWMRFGGFAVWAGLGLWQRWWWLGTNSKTVDPHISTRHGHSCVPTQVPLVDPDKEKSLCWQ